MRKINLRYFGVAFVALIAVGSANGQDAPASQATVGGGPVLRFVNLLAYQDEAIISVDNAPVVGNTISGEVSPLTPISAGEHRLQVSPRRGGASILSADFSVRQGTSSTLILVGGAENPAMPAGQSAPATLVPIPLPLQSAAAQPDIGADDKNKKATCTLVFVNCDLRGSLGINLAAGDQSRTLELKPKGIQVFENWPVAALSLKVLPQFKLGSDQPADARPNLFSPRAPGTYLCILYGQGFDAVRALFLSSTGDGDLGSSPDDVR